MKMKVQFVCCRRVHFFHFIFCGFAVFNQNDGFRVFYMNLDHMSTGK